MKNVCVLMSTYNGEKYLREQLESLITQQEVNINVIIRDDGSSDKTVSIIQSYMKKYANISFFEGERLGPANSFLTLLRMSPVSDYYAFCDQDDFWEKGKIIRAVQKIEEIEKNDKSAPVMYYSNLKIVDENLQFMRMANVKKSRKASPFSSLIYNDVTGCTVVLNNSLRNIINARMPNEITMHDAWCNIVCSFFGKKIYDNDSYILYRQHEHNVIGMVRKRRGFKAILKRILDSGNQPRLMNAKQFYDCYSTDLSEKDLEKLKLFVEYKKSIRSRIRLLINTDIRANNIKSEIKYRTLILLGRI